MGNTQVTSLHPVQVAGDPRAPLIVRNESSKTVYYRAYPFVSSATNDGNLTEHQEVEIIQPTWFVTAEQVDGEVRVFPAVVASITTGQLEPNVVTTPKVTAETVPVPVAAESLTAVAGTAGVARVQSFAYTAKKEANAKVKLIHTLNTTAVQVRAYTTATKLPSELLADGSATAGAIEKVKVESASEVLLTLVAAEPAAKGEYIYVVVG